MDEDDKKEDDCPYSICDGSGVVEMQEEGFAETKKCLCSTEESNQETE